MSANDLQALLRFLSQDAKVPLAMAMSKVKKLQAAKLDTPEGLATVKADAIKEMFPDDKMAKQVISAAKRISKKRAAGDDSPPAPKKRRRESLFFDHFGQPLPPAELEQSLEPPQTEATEDEIKETVLFTNRAPLVLAFLVTLLKHTMPEQPLSSRLSLAQAHVSITSRSRAVYLGIESGKSAEEEGFGEGQPTVTVGGKEIKVIRRWGYEWRKSAKQEEDHYGKEIKDDAEKPALWALDLEAWKKSGGEKQPAKVQAGIHSDLPIYTPQTARAYLLKSFDSPPAADAAASKKHSAAAKAKEKEQNLGKLLRALDLLYDAWSARLSPVELDNQTWSWYVKVRPAVADGAAGWGGKNELKLAGILALRPGT